MKSAQIKNDPAKVNEIPFQPASLDIWDKKYRLKTKQGEPIDQDIDHTYRRVARALAATESTPELREHWYTQFLWALRHGAIPAGRIMSNAGAQEHKPATSTINCTVSGTIRDSMNDILKKVHEAGLTLKAGCGIGYEFSTLRPKGAYVSGAGAYTSGPLSFMDIYDKMCFTVSSAGGRRGAQMATFDIGHPDVMDFIRAKREDGRLRQFNLSLLITDEFMRAVEKDEKWKLAFPLTAHEVETDGISLDDRSQVVWRDVPESDGYVTNRQGQVACRVYREIPARRLWDVIMSSTYDFAEPGFILIDKVNQYNNNWFCENIRATNPCVTADTRLHTQYGLVPIGELYQLQSDLEVTVDNRALGTDHKGTSVRSAVPAFMTAGRADVYEVTTEDGYRIKATAWHDFYTQRGKLPLSALTTDDYLFIQSGKGQFGSLGSRKLGMLIGLMAGNGQFRCRKTGENTAEISLCGERRTLAPEIIESIKAAVVADGIAAQCSGRQVSSVSVPERNTVFIRSAMLAHLLEYYGFNAETRYRVPEVIWRGTEECVKAYLQALFQCDGTLQLCSSESRRCRGISLVSRSAGFLRQIQMLLSNFGICCAVVQRERKPGHVLRMNAQAAAVFMSEIGFLHAPAEEEVSAQDDGNGRRVHRPYRSRIKSIRYLGKQPVYDTTQADGNTVIFNGLVTGQCGEQPLPPYGSCLLGSINLTRFVRDPFSEQARFDWDEFSKVARIFTRMLDNVVEINGLPLEGQRREILHKRRHGMGFLGLGSTMTMLKMGYGSPASLEFTERVSRELALAGWREALALAKEKGPAPIMEQEFEITPQMLRQRPQLEKDGYRCGDKVKGKVLHARYSLYMQQLAEVEPELVEELAEVGARFTHHSSIAPTGTISLSLANNASNGIEPSFAHHYSRNVIREGRKTKEKVDVYSFELLAYRALVDPEAMPATGAEDEHGAHRLPEYFVAADDITPKEHVDVQAAAQKWIDSSISKTANVPTDYPYDDFKDIYRYAYSQGLKGCTTFRFNPAAFQGVLVKDEDLENTVYRFELENGEVIEVKGNEEIEYDGEVHTAANLYDALKEGYYGKF